MNQGPAGTKKGSELEQKKLPGPRAPAHSPVMPSVRLPNWGGLHATFGAFTIKNHRSCFHPQDLLSRVPHPTPILKALQEPSSPQPGGGSRAFGIRTRKKAPFQNIPSPSCARQTCSSCRRCVQRLAKESPFPLRGNAPEQGNPGRAGNFPAARAQRCCGLGLPARES